MSLKKKKGLQQLSGLTPKATEMLAQPPFHGRKLSDSEFLKFFSVGLGKWLLYLMSSGDPKWGVKLLPSYAYRVGKDLDMVSYAFLLSPYIKGLTDSTGLAQAAVPSGAIFNEKLTALALISSVQAIEDLDDLLVRQKQWMQEAQKEAERLLVSARYDVNAYRTWLKKSRQRH